MLRYLYETVAGRCILKFLTKPELSKLVGKFLDSKYSCFLIPYFIKKNNIDMSVYKEEKYRCFNDCFCREIREEYRPIDKREDAFIAPCDGLLSAYRIKKDLVIPVKQSSYSIKDLLKDEKLANEYLDGTCLVFRLCVNHYHRYCYPDSGIKGENVFVPGILHTVRPVALRNVPVFTENSREYTILDTDNFGKVVQMEVGAMLVGKIDNYHHEGEFHKGEEKGKFLYGGSTIILLLKKDKVKFTQKIFDYTDRQKEIPVKMGQKIGSRY